jgi:hypothetical protein
MFGIGHKRRPGRITKLDVLLADALRMYEDSLCSGCGTPTMWAWDIRSSLYMELDPDAPQCQVCELIETRQRDPDPDKQPVPGEKMRVLNHLFEDEEMMRRLYGG